MWNWVALARQSRPKAEQAANDQVARIVDSRDFLARDLEQSIPLQAAESQAEVAELLLKVAPHSPFAVQTLVTREWEKHKTRRRSTRPGRPAWRCTWGRSA
jgi:hypothetical protein